jgi:hypothetical protein
MGSPPQNEILPRHFVPQSEICVSRPGMHESHRNIPNSSSACTRPDKQAAVEKAAQEFKTEVWRLYAVSRR